MDVNQEYAMRYPVVYKLGQDSRMFNFKSFWKQILLACWHGLICFYLPVMGLGGPYPAGQSGLTNEHWY